MATIVFALSRLGSLLGRKKYLGRQCIVLVDENTLDHCLPVLMDQVEELREATVLQVPVGEEAKDMEVAEGLWRGMLETKADRNSVVVNLGGGCVSDIGGFAAACYKRGMPYFNVPTTLVGMVDAAIGGKTAVNIGGVKNAVGLFCQPEATCIDTVFLQTLPAAELRNGLFELLKTLMLSNKACYHDVMLSLKERRDISGEELRKMVTHCATFKDAVVKKDPKDHGIRHMLNLGHTFGHAIEAYGQLPHGVAVGIGLACMMYLSVNKLGLQKDLLEEYISVLRQMVAMPRYTLRDTEALLQLMHQDKKNANSLVLCVLLDDLEVPVIDVAVSDNEIRDTLLKICR